jgi:hypothetical protein
MQGQPERVLRLASAAAGMRERLKTPLSAVEQEEMERVLRDARAALVETTAAKAWEEGRTMSLEETVGYAMG